MIEPKISVIVPVYNAEPYLRKCLDSIRFQTYTNLEVICIDDGSSDNSCAILEEYAGMDERFKVFKQENSGVSVARNNGIEAATGEYISFVDSDDWCLLTLYQEFVNTLNKIGQDIDIYVFNSAVFMDDKNDAFPIRAFELADWVKHQSKYTIHTFDDCQKPFTRNMAVTNKIYRREYLLENNILFPPRLKYEDMAFNIISLLNAKSVLLNDDVLYRYRVTDRVTLSTEVVEQVFDVFKIVDIIENEISRLGLYESYKYAFFQFKYNVFVKYYGYCPDKMKESYFNKMKFILLSAETNDLDSRIASHLRNYELFKQVKNCTRKAFDKFYKKYSQMAN